MFVVEGYESGLCRKFKLGPDLVEECKAVIEAPEPDGPVWQPLFEPHDFNESHAPLQIEEYRLSKEDLKLWAERSTKLRAEIVEKAKRYAEEEPAEALDGPQGRTRKGHKLSKAAHNEEGMPESKLKQLRVADKVWTCKLKKRHRKDLSVEEIQAIVRESEEPFRYHKDIAQKFRIPARLVGALVQESQKKPEKLQSQFHKELLEERKRQAIEEAVDSRLKANMPIVRAQ